MVITFFILLNKEANSETTETNDSDVANNIDPRILNYYFQLQKFEIHERDACIRSGAYARTKGNKTYYSFLKPLKFIRKRDRINLFDCFEIAKKNNASLTVKHFIDHHEHIEFPTSLDCQIYINLLSILIDNNPHYLQLNVGEIDNIDIFVIVPSQFSHVFVIERFMHKSIDQVFSMFAVNSEYSNPLKDITLIPENLGFSDIIYQAVYSLFHTVASTTKDKRGNKREHTIPGPTSLLYLLGQQMRCRAPLLFPNYIKSDFFEIERINSDWMVFNITERSFMEERHNVTFIFELKAENLTWDTRFSELFKITLMAVDDRLTFKKQLIGQILDENVGSDINLKNFSSRNFQD